MAERHLQKACLDLLPHICPDAVALNIHGSGWTGRGAPDVLMCIKGRFAAAELKVGSNGLSEAQVIWRDRILEAGGAWCCPRTTGEFERFVRGVMDGAGREDS